MAMLTLRSRRPSPGRLRCRRGESHLSGRRGYSLPEMLVTMAVVGLMGLIVVPSIEMVRFRLDGAARGAMAALVASQRLAVQRQHDVIVTFDTLRTRLLIHEDADNDGARDPGERVRPVTFDEGVRFGLGSAAPLGAQEAPVSFRLAKTGLPTLRFLRSGSASEEGRFYLTSERAAGGGGPGEDTRAVQVDRATGRVSWYRFAPPEWTPGL